MEKKIKKVKVSELAKAIVDGLFSNDKGCIFFASGMNGKDAECWHGASIVQDGSEKLLIVRYCGGYGEAFYCTLYHDYESNADRRDKFTEWFEDELRNYLCTNDFDEDEEGKDYVAYLEYEE